jgi:cytoskeleton protein RodZ
MSDGHLIHQDLVVSAPEVSVSNSAGAMLKAARENQSMSIAALAAALKVPVKKLEALECDRYELLPDLVFVRALAASICRSLNIDPAPILASLPSPTDMHLSPKAPAMSVPFRVPRVRLGASFGDHLSKRLIFVVLLLLSGVLVLVFAPTPQFVNLVGSQLSDVNVASTQSAPVLQTMATTIPLPSGAASNDLTPALIRQNQHKGPNQGSVGSGAIAPVLVSNMPTRDASTVLAEAVGLVVFKARGASWVEVVDATASVKLRKTLAQGDVVSASGVAPLSVVVGRADVVDVQWRDKPVDLIPIIKENVARFEVK